MSFARRKEMIHHLSSMAGMLGWRATQVHENTVAMQLVTMSHNVLQLCKSLQDDGKGVPMLGIGSARALGIPRQ